jgi:uncharacterized protein YfkK (UPF0435 family)
MDLSQATQENVEYMINEIKKKLKMATGAAIKPSHFGVDQYEDIKYMYDMIIGKPHFSIAEMEAIVHELGQMRKI